MKKRGMIKQIVEYFFIMICCSPFRQCKAAIQNSDLSEFITGQAQPKLNQKNLSNINIPLPTLAEQKKIALEVRKSEKKIAELEKRIDAMPKEKEVVLKKYLE
jgi:restriction endonuclease S subunit